METISDFLGGIPSQVDAFGHETAVTISRVPSFIVELYKSTVKSRTDSPLLVKLKMLLRLSLDKRFLGPVFDRHSKYLHAAWFDPRYFPCIASYFDSINKIHGWPKKTVSRNVALV